MYIGEENTIPASSGAEDWNERRRCPRPSATHGYEEAPKILIKDPQMLHNISSAWGHVDANVIMIITLCFVYNSDTVYEFKPPMNLKQPRPDTPCSWLLRLLLNVLFITSNGEIGSDQIFSPTTSMACYSSTFAFVLSPPPLSPHPPVMCHHGDKQGADEVFNLLALWQNQQNMFHTHRKA